MVSIGLGLMLMSVGGVSSKNMLDKKREEVYTFDYFVVNLSSN